MDLVDQFHTNTHLDVTLIHTGHRIDQLVFVCHYPWLLNYPTLSISLYYIRTQSRDVAFLSTFLAMHIACKLQAQ